MNEIVVGVKPIGNGVIAAPGEEAYAAFNCMWVMVDGVELPLKDALIKASTEVSSNFLTVTLELVASGFRTARWDGPEAPERWRAT